MKLLLGILVLLQLNFAAYSQSEYTSVNREEVEKAIGQKDATTFYPKLLERFNKFDTTLSIEDFRLLYYGHVFQPGYSGYDDHKDKEASEAINSKNYKKAIQICDGVLKEIPISLKANFLKAVALSLANPNDTLANAYFWRYHKLVQAIISSGDGMTCKSAYKTIFVTDEYDIIFNYFRVKQSNGQALEGNCDRLTITPSEYYVSDHIYFDTSETLNALENMFKSDKKKKN